MEPQWYGIRNMTPLLLAVAMTGTWAERGWVPPPCAPVFSSGPFAGGDNVLKPCGPDSASDGSRGGGTGTGTGDGGSVAPEVEYKAMSNGVCEAGWEPIPANGPYGSPGAFEECAAAARALKILPVGPWSNGSQPGVGGRDEKDLPAGCYFYELPVVGFQVFFGMQGSYSQTDGQRRVICKRRSPLPAGFCCTPNTVLTLGHGSTLPFGNGMVLQHGRPAAIFGLAKAGATVVVAYGNKSYSTTANPDPFASGWSTPLASNSWRIELDPQPPGPATGNITATCADCDTNASTATLSDVLFGEVFICSGDSSLQRLLR